MPTIQWSLDFGDLLILVISLVFIPVTRSLITTLWMVRDSVRDLTHIVVGEANDPASGLTGRVAELSKESTRHRNWLIRLSTEHGSKMEDRS